MDITKAIEPRSDQQNADSFLTGPRTIKIRDIKYDPTAEQQPLWIYFEGDEGKPWKPCRTAARCLVHVWGANATKWVGLSCTLYCDPEVTFGAARVGGIRISHMEGLKEPRTLQLTKTRGKKGATVIKPLEVATPANPAPTTVKVKPSSASVIVDRTEMQRQMTDVDGDAARKKEWWAGLTDDEKAVVKELAAGQAN